MLLSTQDIAKLVKKGYSKGTFVRKDSQGYSLLRNRQGYCVFYNINDRKCEVYSVRPSGCRVYPVILDEERGIVIDAICRAQATISDEEKMKRGKKVISLLKKIDEQVETLREKQGHI